MVRSSWAAAGAVVRDVQMPGSPVLAATMAERFGADILDQDGALDARQRSRRHVSPIPRRWKGPQRHRPPGSGGGDQRRVSEQVATDHVVVLDIPLLTENPRDGLQGKIVVDVPVEVQVDRLVRFRGFDEADARARIARQSTREQRLDGASFVVDNSGDLDDLAPQIDALWTWLLSLPQLPEDHQFGGRSESPEEPAE
ncbi:MAG: dephospho-CoA kinase [Ilumatobacteraceae bacterium]